MRLTIPKCATAIERRGLSVLEATGCVLAVGLGVWLGAHFLGVDLGAAAYTALADEKVVDKLPEGWRPAPPAGMEPPSPEEQAAELHEELTQLRQEVEELQHGVDESDAGDLPAGDVSASAGNEDSELAARRQHTLALWSRLGSVRAEVEELQQSAEWAVTEQNVWKVLEIYHRSYQYGAKAVRATMGDGVDPQAWKFADQLASWYEQGADLYGEAMQVWQGQHLPPQGLSSDELLAQVRKQHVNEGLLLFQKGARLRDVLIRRYQVAFPDIDDPGSTDGP